MALLNLTLVTAGAAITGVGVAVSAHQYFLSRGEPSNVASGVFLPLVLALAALALLLFGFFSRVIDLSRKYYEALLTMNVIKEFYIRELKDEMPQLEQALQWRLDGIPALGRVSGTTFFLGSVIALFGSLYLGEATELSLEYLASQGHGFDIGSISGCGSTAPIPLCLGPVHIWGLAMDVPVFLLAVLFFALYYLSHAVADGVPAKIAANAQTFGLKVPAVQRRARWVLLLVCGGLAVLLAAVLASEIMSIARFLGPGPLTGT
jgi:hypothetical protein